MQLLPDALQGISRWSGYGRSGAWRSRRWHRIYTLDNSHTEYRDCSGATLPAKICIDGECAGMVLLNLAVGMLMLLASRLA
jgi:hypothetical protein